MHLTKSNSILPMIWRPFVVVWSFIIALLFLLTPLSLISQHDEDLGIKKTYQLYLDQPSAETLIEYAYSMWFNDLDSAVVLMRETIKLATEEGDSIIIAAAFHDMARLQLDLNHLDSTEFYFQQAIDLAKKFNLKDKVAYAYNTRAYVRFNFIKNIKGALDDVNHAILLFEQMEDYLGLSFCYQNLGDFYYHFNQMEVAIDMYYRIEEYRKKNREPTPLYNQVEAIWNIGNALIKANRENEAVTELNRALDLVGEPREEYNGFLWSQLHLIRSQAYTGMGDYVKARKDITIAEASFHKTSFLNIQELYNYSKGYLFFKSNDYDKALVVLNKLIVIPHAELADPLIKLEAYLMVEKIYAAHNKLDKAYLAHSHYSQLRDTLFNPQHLGYMLQEVRNYDDILKVKNEEIAESYSLTAQLNTLNTRNKFIIAILIIGLLLSVYFFTRFQYKEKLRREELRTKISKDLHDEVGGILAGIALQSDIIQSKELKHKTEIKGIGYNCRMAMSKMGDVLWSIDARRDSQYDLEQRMREHGAELLIPLGIKYDFQSLGFVDRKLDPEMRQNIYLIYKEAFNNIVKHAVEPTKVHVIVENGSTFKMRIVNDGKSPNRKSGKKGQGLENMKSRATFLKGSISTTRLPPGGFKVELTCPKL